MLYIYNMQDLSVNEQLKNVNAKLRLKIDELVFKNTRFREENGFLRKENEELSTKYSRFQKENVELRKMVEELVAKAARMENGSDDEPPPVSKGFGYLDKVKKKPGKKFGKVKKKNSRGAKKGHKGHGRKKCQKIDKEVDLTLDKCPDCGGSLMEHKNPEEHVKEDLVIVKVATKYLVHRYQCSCCKKEVQPAYKQGFIGDTAKSLSTLMHYHCGVPFNKIQEIFNWFGLQICEGSLALWGKKMGKKFLTCYENLKKNLQKAAYVNADETGWPIDGDNNWLWVFRAPDFVVFKIDETRGSRVVGDVLGDDFEGVLCSDFYSSYNPSDYKKQKCLVHLLRDLRGWQESESFEKRSLHYGIHRLFDKSVKLSKRHDELSHDAYEKRTKKFFGDFGEFLEIKYADADCKRIMKRLRKHRDELWTFLKVEVPYHNNHAELSIRRSVVNRKVSNGNRSQKGAETQEILLSIIQTAKMQGKNLLDLMLKPQSYPLCAT